MVGLNRSDRAAQIEYFVSWGQVGSRFVLFHQVTHKQSKVAPRAAERLFVSLETFDLMADSDQNFDTGQSACNEASHLAQCASKFLKTFLCAKLFLPIAQFRELRRQGYR